MSDKKGKFKFSKFLKEFDYFGAEMKFRINQEEKYKSKLGGGIFLIYFLVALAYVGYNFYQFAWRKNQTLSFSSKIMSPAPTIYLNSTNFTFSLGVLFNDNYTSAIEPFSQYLEYSINHIAFAEGNFIETQIPTALCNQSDFNNIPEKNFYWNSLNTTLCPIIKGNHSNLVIKGDFTDESTSYLYLVASLKDQVVNNITKYLEFKKFLNENPILIQLYMVDTKIDYEEYSDFLGNYLTVINSFASLNQVKFYEISLSKLTFKTDNNILWQMQDESNSVMFSKSDYNSYSVEDRDKIDILEKNVLNKFFIKSTSRAFFYERNYQKLTDFLANMTGILSQIILIIFVVINYLNDKAASQKVMRKIMKFKQDGNYHVDKILSLFKNERIKNDNQLNIIENNQILNSNKILLKNDEKINEIDIHIELGKFPETYFQNSPIREVGANVSCQSGRNELYQDVKSTYEYPTENLPGNIFNSNKNNTDFEESQKSNKKQEEINTQNISQNSPMENNILVNNSPQQINNFSLNEDILKKYSCQRDIFCKYDEDLKLSATHLHRNSSSSNINLVKCKTVVSEKNLRLEKKTENQTTYLKNLSTNDNPKNEKPSISTEKSNLFTNLELQNNKKIKPLKFSYCHLLVYSVFCKSCKNKSKKNILFKKAEKKVKYYLDVLTYIKMMSELDLLKEIIFSDNQRYLLEFLAKPLLDDKGSRVDLKYYKRKSRKAFTIDNKGIEELYKCYKKVKTHENKLDENSLRLIKKIDEEIEMLKN